MSASPYLKVLPRGVLLLNTHFHEGNCGGRRLNQYTLSMEAMIDTLPPSDKPLPLISTAAFNDTDALLYVDAQGRIIAPLLAPYDVSSTLGGSSNGSGRVFTPGKWLHLTLLCDCIENEVIVFVNGERKLTFHEKDAHTAGAAAVIASDSRGTSISNQFTIFATKDLTSCHGGNLRYVIIRIQTFIL